MVIYRILSALLSYPEAELIEALPDIEVALDDTPQIRIQLQPLIDHLRSHDLIALQEAYVADFDRSRHNSLYLFEHIHGESRDRGDAQLDLLREYQRHGFEPDDRPGSACEMPDYLPLFLEFLSMLEADRAAQLLGDAVNVWPSWATGWCSRATPMPASSACCRRSRPWCRSRWKTHRHATWKCCSTAWGRAMMVPSPCSSRTMAWCRR